MNVVADTKMFLNKIRNIFCVPDTKCVSATNVARAGKRGNICVGNNGSSFARAFIIMLCCTLDCREFRNKERRTRKNRDRLNRTRVEHGNTVINTEQVCLPVTGLLN